MAHQEFQGVTICSPYFFPFWDHTVSLAGELVKQILLSLFLIFVFASCAGAREKPARDLPVPATVSPELQQLISAGPAEWWQTFPETYEQWIHFRQERDDVALQALPGLRKAVQVTSEAGRIAGVPVFTISPKTIPAQNRDKVLLHLHGGGYVLNAGEAGTGEAVYMAGIGGFRVISVDYRMPPDYPYPAALDDAMQVYRVLLKDYPSSHIGVFGTSTGGGLTLALVLRAKKEGLPLPGAIVAGTPWTDLTKTGDSYFTNDHIDNVLVGYDGWLKAAAHVYAAGHDMKDPFLSPVYGDVTGFPPTLLATGTRDLFLSNTVRMHRKLRESGAVTDLLVLEGASHAHYLMLPPDAPEAQYYFRQAAEFFERYLK